MEDVMKKIRIGAGAGCSGDRIEPAVDLAVRGNLDYLVFECLAERSMAINLLNRRGNPEAGYNKMLRERMEAVLEPAYRAGTVIITNMGGANTREAVKVVKEVAERLGLKGLKIGAVYGDDVTDIILKENDPENPEQILGANVYLGAEGIVRLLEDGCDVILTGRIADASLFTAPLFYEFGWTPEDDRSAQATLVGHLLECCGQVSGGFCADPGFKDIEAPWELGFPLAEISEDGTSVLTKLDGTGGEISPVTVKEQLVYEIFDLSAYYTPDLIVDFSDVRVTEIGKNRVSVQNAKAAGIPETFKVTISRQKGYTGVGRICFAGSNALRRAELCEKIIRERMKITGAEGTDVRFDYVGHSAIYPMPEDAEFTGKEICLRMFVRAGTCEEVQKVLREFDFMYTNGPAGSCAIETAIRPMLGVDSCYLARDKVQTKTEITEV